MSIDYRADILQNYVETMMCRPLTIILNRHKIKSERGFSNAIFEG